MTIMQAAEPIPYIPDEHRCSRMLRYLCEHDVVSQTKLMQVGSFSESIQGPLCAYTAFEYWMLQIDAQLRPFGFRVEEHGIGYRVVPTHGVQ